jgi:hypothetical protein
MKSNIQKHFLLMLISVGLLALSSCDMSCKNKGPEHPLVPTADTVPPTGPSKMIVPTTVSGIIIDENGGTLPTAAGNVRLQGPTGASGASGPVQTTQISNGKYSFETINNGMIPAIMSCVPSSPAGTCFYSVLDSSDTIASPKKYIVLNTSTTRTAAEFEIIFLNHDGSPPTMPTNIGVVNISEGPGSSLLQQSAAGAVIGWAIFSPIVANNKYTLNYTPSGGTPQSLNFVAPSAMASRATVGYTVYLK